MKEVEESKICLQIRHTNQNYNNQFVQCTTKVSTGAAVTIYFGFVTFGNCRQSIDMKIGSYKMNNICGSPG